MKNEKLPENLRDRQIGFAVLRLMLGVHMLGRGIVRFPKLQEFASGTANAFSETILPSGFVYVYAILIVIVETVLGVLLILGWKTSKALAVMGLLMCTLAFGMILQENFGTAGNILVYCFAISFLLFNTRYDAFGIDGRTEKRKKVPTGK